jgi:Ni2+-binding GTPase involved in maturation of urease and hydrogenase
MLNHNQNAFYPNILLVAGTGRNSGKTTLVTSICEYLKDSIAPICIKISNHFHAQIGSFCHYESEGFRIFEDTNPNSEKDTARMLKAGAARAFFIEAEDNFVYQAFEHVLQFIPQGSPVICESGSLRNYITPGKFILLQTEGVEPKEKSLPLIPLADHYWISQQGRLIIPSGCVIYNNNTWEIAHIM